MEERIVQDRINLTQEDQKWNYFSKEAMKKLHPKSDFKILGEITEKLSKNKRQIHMSIQPKGTYCLPGYMISGYLWNNKNQGYVIVKKKIIIPVVISIAIFAIIAVTVGILVWAFAFRGSNGPNLDPNTSHYQASVRRTEGMDSSKILIPGFDNWNMYAGNTELYVALVNPEENPCYFQYDVVLDATGEILFSTGLISPGDAVTTVKLPRTFAKGEYPITVKINTYSLDDYTQKLNGGESKTKIVVYEKG